ncbi:MAG: hypothetical protein M3Q16_08865, partial [Pseudomonadota bacterium]|nr:hypothetical protein [Pseudomonadota bacterium]
MATLRDGLHDGKGRERPIPLARSLTKQTTRNMPRNAIHKGLYTRHRFRHEMPRAPYHEFLHTTLVKRLKIG